MSRHPAVASRQFILVVGEVPQTPETHLPQASVSANARVINHDAAFGMVADVETRPAAGCLQTRSEVEVKPVDINLNITGRLELVITGARKQEEQITGSAPASEMHELPPRLRIPSAGRC